MKKKITVACLDKACKTVELVSYTRSCYNNQIELLIYMYIKINEQIQTFAKKKIQQPERIIHLCKSFSICIEFCIVVWFPCDMIVHIIRGVTRLLHIKCWIQSKQFQQITVDFIWSIFFSQLNQQFPNLDTIVWLHRISNTFIFRREKKSVHILNWLFFIYFCYRWCCAFCLFWC